MDAVESGRHAELGALLSSDGDAERFPLEVVRLWRRSTGARAAAIYVPTSAGFQLIVCDGGVELPARFESLPPDLVTRRVGGGLVVAVGGEDDPSQGSLSLLLAAATRLCVLDDRLRQHDFAARYRGVELEALHDVGLAIASTLDQQALVDEILARAVALLDARRGALFLTADGALVLSGTIGGDAPEHLEAPWTADAPLLPGARHQLGAPISIDGKERGLLVLADKESRHGVGPFTGDDERRLALLANQAAIALEQARLHREGLEKERLEREMELAAMIQREILPRQIPRIDGYEILGWTRPSRHVGGDYYDFIPLPDGRLAVALADVSGKGVPAALLVSTVHSALRLLLERGESLAELTASLNAHLLAFSADNKYATLFLVTLSADHSRVEFLSAGHNPGLVLSEDGTTATLDAIDVPVGLLPWERFHAQEIELGAGDLLCLYSDGITEAEDLRGEELGLARLEAILREHRRRPLEEIRDVVRSILGELAGGAPRGDDQTLVLVRRAS